MSEENKAQYNKNKNERNIAQYNKSKNEGNIATNNTNPNIEKYSKKDKDNKAINKKQAEKEKMLWSKESIENATRKINREIYEHDKQASISIKLDDLSIFVNDKIRKRGIYRGFVCVQEDFNKNLLKIEKIISQALLESDSNKKRNLLIEAEHNMKIELWGDIRFLMINKAITPGEITELIRRQKAIDTEIHKWIASIS